MPMRNPRDVLIRPIITEKSVSMHEDKRYTFQVHPDANKIEIKYAVETIFGVQVDRVRTISVPGKRRRVGAHVGYTSDWKKAVVILKPNSKPIGFFEGL
jgi:large subunit ribosomal protein L23